MSRKHPKKKATSLRTGEVATKERRHHNGGVVTEVIDRDLSGKACIMRHKAAFVSVLDRYLAHKKISESQHKAGVRFQYAYYRAVLRIRVDDIGPGAQGDPEMAMLIVVKSEKLLRKAYAALTPKQKEMVITVCGHDEYAQDSYRLETLQRGLEKLAVVWRL